VTPAPGFVQQVNKRGAGSSLSLQLNAAVSAGDRLVVEVGVWSTGHTTASGVTDSAGNAYTRLTSVKASDGTELSVWSAPVTAGDGTRATITVSAGTSADIGMSALEYSGLSAATGTGAVDQSHTATGTTGTAATNAVAAGATAPSAGAGEVAVGFYADSGFANPLAGDPAYGLRTNVSPTNDIELLAQDRVLGAAGATANPSTTTGPRTPWVAATVVFKTAALAGAQVMAMAAPATRAATSTAASPGRLVYASAVVNSLDPLGTRNVFLCPLGPQAKGALLRRLAAVA
jgi:hypothetical protein